MKRSKRVHALAAVTLVALGGGLIDACESTEAESGLWYYFASERQARGLFNTRASSVLHDTALQNAIGVCDGTNGDLVADDAHRKRRPAAPGEIATADAPGAVEAVAWRESREDKFCRPNGSSFVNDAWTEIMARGTAMDPQWTDAGVAVYVCDGDHVLSGLTCVSFLYARQ